MPYKSRKQMAKFHALAAQGKLDPKIVAEFDQASKGMSLPEYAPKKAKSPKRSGKAIARAAKAKRWSV